MNPIYKFELTAGNVTQRAYPTYGDDLSKDFEKESGQEFFRAKLSGNLTFQGDDYTFIASKAFDTEFVLEIFISYDAGQTWSSYWKGDFYKTDCDFDEDCRTVSVKPSVLDRYTDVLAGLDKEYNLIELAPELAQIKADKRPMIQVYVPGQSVVGCFLAGMWWEQECEPESDEGKLTQTGDGKLNFFLNKSERVIDVTQTGTPALPDTFATTKPSSAAVDYEATEGGYKFIYTVAVSAAYTTMTFRIVRVSDSVVLWEYVYRGTNPPVTFPYSVTLQPVSGTDAVGTVELYLRDMNVYARYICDTDAIVTGGSTLNTFELSATDIVGNNRNYGRVIGYDFPDTILFSTLLTSTPTQWGIYQPGQYYFNPADNPVLGISEAFPVARNAWGRVSIWFAFSEIDWLVEASARQAFMIRHAYPLFSVISVLLGKIAPGVTHAEGAEYSEFLYDEDILGLSRRLFITPKSNIITAGYDHPAQKAPITLKNVLDMLRDCYRCYWFIDDDNRFRIEHVKYFQNGGSYSVSPTVGTDLTEEEVTRSGKKWAFASNQYKFDKPDTAARYQFGWMDDVTQLFEGYPIEIVSKYVDADKIEQVEITQFTSDLDYILLNPSEISSDGFVLLSAVEGNSGEFSIPYYNYVVDGTNHYLQNGYAAFCFLQNYYAYDMPAPQYSINGESKTAIGTKKLKEQNIRFPALIDPELFELIKTNLGNGMIKKLSLNLSSRNANATLMYDTE